MEFCELTHPRYLSDQGYARANPIRMLTEFLYVPGITCPACGSGAAGGWASSSRVRVEVPSGDPLRSELRGISLQPEAWHAEAERLRQRLKIPAWIPIEPGAEIGMPKAEVRQRQVPDLLHPFPGRMVVRARVVDALQAARLTGFQPIRVQTQWAKKLRGIPEEPPELYELFITGAAWRAGVDLDMITACRVCGRTIFPGFRHLVVDESRWDGSDFLNVDRNPNIVVVTQRVRDVLVDNKFTNWECSTEL